MWGIVLLIFFVAGSRQISITEFSVPDSIESGGDAPLQCGYELSWNETVHDLTVKWWFTPLGESVDKRIQLYQRIVGHPPESIKLDIEIKGSDDILLQNVTPESSGTYECEVSALEDEKRQRDDLIVFSKGELWLNVTEVEDGPDEDDDKDVLVTCEATDVAPFPVLVISVNEEVVITNDTLVLEQDNNTFNATNTVTLSRERADGAEIACELFWNTTHEPYKVTETYNVGSTGANGTSSSLLLVILAILCNIFYIKK
ncbi:sodium channel subunit beta-2 isoform X2 [Bicyclus anynana]|uniref:Sodium channel subunit beta-2 isoform X2 n=1 Tax=Bicyclus anynana TaxID=110368 RepID=A0A6J1MLL2_BICAN|nr:sodium channel subunit beta-2 isoform X2 [Bicyclus anynana]